ncbi:MAG: tetratricopeptide repeat protein [Sphaerochaetaceae bacterium]|jgi:Flp pilus assembly protein TadD
MSASDPLNDIIFITLPDSPPTQSGEFSFDPTIALPVQLPEGSTTIEADSGLRIEQIAAGLIKVIAHNSSHANFDYYCDLLLALQPDVVHELHTAAVAKAQTEDEQFAEELFLAAVHLNPHIAELYVNLGILYGQQARKARDANQQHVYDEAITKQMDTLRKGLEVLPYSELLLKESGMLNLFLGNDEIAYEQLNAYLAQAKDSEEKELIAKKVEELGSQIEDEQTLQAAFDEMQLGNEEQALRLATTYATNNPRLWSGFFLQGWALRRLGRYQEAQSAFLRCLELGEQNADIYNELSICALELGERQLSQEYLEIALELDEESVKLISNLAFLKLEEQQYQEVQHLLNRGLALDAQDPALLYIQKELNKRTGTFEEDDVIDA